MFQPHRIVHKEIANSEKEILKYYDLNQEQYVQLCNEFSNVPYICCLCIDREVTTLIQTKEDIFKAVKAGKILKTSPHIPKELTHELYIAIIRQVKACIRYTLYIKIKSLTKHKQREIAKGKTEGIEVDKGDYFEQVCVMHGIKKDADDNYEMMMKRAKYIFSVDTEFSQLLEAEKKCNQKLVSVIIKGYELPDMDKNPLIISDKDLNVSLLNCNM